MFPTANRLKLAFFLLQTVACLVLFSSVSAQSAEIPSPRPRPCVGYNLADGRWGLLQSGPGKPYAECDPGSAVMFVLPLFGKKRPAPLQPLRGSCCPVPEGSLLNEHEYSSGKCFPDSVVTGVRIQPGSMDPRGNSSPRYELRCTKINTQAFRLEKSQKSWKLEYGQTPSKLGMIGIGSQERTLNRGRIPQHIRYGFGRLSKTKWVSSGCFSLPWGSVLSGMSEKSCEDFEFQQIVPIRKSNEAERTCILLSLTDPTAKCVFLD